MKNKKTYFVIAGFIILLLCITGYIYINSTNQPTDQNSEQTTGPLIDDDAIYKWVSSEKDYVYYKNNDVILPTSEETERAHNNFMRVRFNKIAASVLNAEGKLPDGSSFPDSSIISQGNLFR